MDEKIKKVEITSDGREEVSADELLAAMKAIAMNPSKIFSTAASAYIAGISESGGSEEPSVVESEMTTEELEMQIRELRSGHMASCAGVSMELNRLCFDLAQIHGEDYIVPALLMTAGYFEAIRTGQVDEMIEDSTEDDIRSAKEFGSIVDDRMMVDKLLKDSDKKEH